MLIRFNVKNFLSFDEESEFSLIANKERRLPSHYKQEEGINILKSSVIYGANASGKSNLIKAIDFSRKVILRGIDRLNPINKHFRLKEGNRRLPSIFQYEIKAEGKFYSYGFAAVLNENKIVEEWLYEVGSNKKDKKIFERVINDKGKHDIEIGFNPSKETKKRFEVYCEDFQDSDRLLFLSEINRKSIGGVKEMEGFKNVYNWFDNKLTVLFPHSKYAEIHLIGDNNKMKKVFSNFLKVFQTGIDKIAFEEIDLENLNLPKEVKESLKNIDKETIILFNVNDNTYSLEKTEDNQYRIKKIVFEHLNNHKYKVLFDLADESDGTQRLLDFIPSLFTMASSDAVFIIDELDRSLHSQLAYKIFELFFSLTKKNESQLIVSTHESLLLDLELLRRDEIWFVEKQNNQSRLYSLDQFKVRNDKIIRKDYLLGRYGAIPIFKSFKNLNL